MNRCRSFHTLVFLLFALGLGVGCSAKRPAQERLPLAEIPPIQAYVFHGRVISGPNSPVAGAEVTLYGTKGTTRQLASDAEGKFQFALDEDFTWHTHVVAKKGEQVSAYLYLYPEEDLTGELRLGEPSTLTGRVTLDSGAPAPGATVRLAAEKGHGTSIAEGETDAEGNYQIAGVAPGVYAVHLSHERFTLTRLDDPLANEGPSVTLEPGGTTARDLDAVEKAFISGKLIGPTGAPVADQKITNGWDSWNHPLTTFQTDEKGHFSGYLPPWPSDRSFRIEHPTLGFGMLKVPPLSPGEHLEGLKEQLGGTMRLTGVVSGPNGEPVAGVRIGNTLSDNLGRYDTGWMYLEHAVGPFHVDVVPPGQSGFLSPPQISMLTKDAEGKPRMYRRTFINVESAHGQTREVPVHLLPMKSRELRGAVQDEEGRPVGGATVLVYQGEAITEQWISDLVPRLPREPEPRRKNWTWTPPEGPAFLMDRVETDSQGQWQTTVFPVPISMACTGRPGIDPLNHTVAVMSGNKVLSGLARVYLPSDPEGPVDIDVCLNPIGADEMLKVVIQDQDGSSLEGIAWKLNCDYGYLVSDGDGILSVPRIASSIDLTLEDRRYCIQEVTATGTIALAPEPSGDPVREYAGLVGRVRCHRGLGTSGDPVTTAIEWDKRWVEIPFFDAAQGGVVITVAEFTALAEGYVLK